MAPKPTDGPDREAADGGGDAGASGKSAIQVLIVDDHPLVRRGIRSLLESQPDIQVAGEAEAGEQALRVLDRRRVDIVLMDARMPGIGGIEATRRVRAAHPMVRVVVLTAYPEHAPDAFKAGASGYVLKGDHSEGLLAAIRSVYYGATVIPETLAGRVSLPGSVRLAPMSPFSPREIEVLRLVARGLTNRAIARELGIGPRTADQHLHSIFIKAGVTSRASAVRYALEHNLAENPAT